MKEKDTVQYNQIAGQKMQRAEALSDGVFAIAMTLLVLDIKVPISTAIKTEADLFAALCSLTPRLVSYFLGFMTLGIFWLGHSTQFNYIEKGDRRLNWITIFFLMFISLLPFTTAFLSEHIDFRLSIGLYWLNILIPGLALYIHWKYAEHHGYLSLSPNEKEAITKAIKKRIIIAQTLYAAGALLCFINNYLSIGVIFLIQLNYALGLLNFRRKKQEVHSI